MKINHPTAKSLFAAALMLVGLSATSLRADDVYKFKVHNNTKQAIKKILVSEDGKTYGHFDIGSGIKAGDTVELAWNKSTNDGKCEQYFKAVFADDEDSEPVKFDFCEKDLVLEF